MTATILRFLAIWTPWSQLLCFPCHGRTPKGGRQWREDMTDEVWATYSAPQPLTVAQERETTLATECSECSAPIWADRTVGPCQIAVSKLQALGYVNASLWQTGGMCSAAGLTWGDRYFMLTALDGPISLGVYYSEDNPDEDLAGEYVDGWGYPDDAYDDDDESTHLLAQIDAGVAWIVANLETPLSDITTPDV